MDENVSNPNEFGQFHPVDKYLQDLQNPDPTVCLAAIKGLENLGCGEQRVIEALKKVAEEERGTEISWRARRLYIKFSQEVPSASFPIGLPARMQSPDQIGPLNYSNGKIIGSTFSIFFRFRALWGVIFLMTVVSSLLAILVFSALISSYVTLLLYLFICGTFWYLTAATIQLTVQRIAHAGEEKVGSALKAGFRWLLPQIGMSLLIWIPGGILIILIELVFSQNAEVYYVLTFPVNLILSGIYFLGLRALIIDQLSVVNSIAAGWKLFSHKWLNYLGLTIVIGLLLTFVLFLGYFFLIDEILTSTNLILTNPELSFAAFVFVFLLVVFTVTAFMNVFWTVAYLSWRIPPNITTATVPATRGLPLQPVS